MARRYLKDGDYIVVPDLQIPSHDQRAVTALCQFITDYEPTGVLNVGDEADSPSLQGGTKGRQKNTLAHSGRTPCV